VGEEMVSRPAGADQTLQPDPPDDGKGSIPPPLALATPGSTCNGTRCAAPWWRSTPPPGKALRRSSPPGE